MDQKAKWRRKVVSRQIREGVVSAKLSCGHVFLLLAKDSMARVGDKVRYKTSLQCPTCEKEPSAPVAA